MNLIEFLLLSILVFTSEISHSQLNDKKICCYDITNKRYEQDSLKFISTLKAIYFNPNDRDSELTHNLFELVFETNSTLNNNDKLALMCFFIAKQDMNFHEFWNLIKTNKTKMLKSNEVFLYLFTPFKEFSEQYKNFNIDTSTINNFSIENQLLLNQIVMFVNNESNESMNVEKSYQRLLLNYMKTSTCLINNFDLIK